MVPCAQEQRRLAAAELIEKQRQINKDILLLQRKRKEEEMALLKVKIEQMEAAAAAAKAKLQVAPKPELLRLKSTVRQVKFKYYTAMWCNLCLRCLL